MALLLVISIALCLEKDATKCLKGSGVNLIQKKWCSLWYL